LNIPPIFYCHQPSRTPGFCYHSFFKLTSTLILCDTCRKLFRKFKTKNCIDVLLIECPFPDPDGFVIQPLPFNRQSDLVLWNLNRVGAYYECMSGPYLCSRKWSLTKCCTRNFNGNCWRAANSMSVKASHIIRMNNVFVCGAA